jgi:DNA repair protein RadC
VPRKELSAGARPASIETPGAGDAADSGQSKGKELPMNKKNSTTDNKTTKASARAQRSYVMPVYKLQLVRDGEIMTSEVRGAVDIARNFSDVAISDRETMVVIFLDAKNRIIGRHTVSMGTVNATIAMGRDIFRAALVAGVVNAIILVHNHPSGVTTPSSEDDSLTHKISLAGTLLDIELFDHVILGPDGSYFSYADQRRI